MFSSVERTISLFANLIAIVTFVAAVLGWVDTSLIPEYAPPTTATATLIILFYAVMASFGSASILKSRTQEGKSVALHIAIFVLIFAFSVAYLQGFLTRNLGSTDVAEVVSRTQVAAIAIYMVVHGAWHYGPIMYPRGLHPVDLFTAAFRPGFYHGLFILLIELAALSYLIDAFSKAGPA
jgi:hypothetical protein